MLLSAVAVLPLAEPAGANPGPGARTVFDIPGSGYAPGERVVALTSDDGPDPRYTPQILQILADRGAPATFFMTGRMAASRDGRAYWLVAQPPA